MNKLIEKSFLMVKANSYAVANLSIIALWLLSFVSKFLFQGEILGFDFGIFQPDGASYTFRTLSFLGEDETEAARRVSAWYAVHGINHNIIDYKSLLPENSPVWYLSAPRVVYPLLSVPFVYFLGINGMLIVPALSLLIVLLLIMKISRDVRAIWAGLIVSALTLCSPTVSRWMYANITDGLLVAEFAIFLYLFHNIKKVKLWYFWVGIIIIISSFTRFSAPIWFGLAIVIASIRDFRKAIFVFLVSLVGLIPLLMYSPTKALFPNSRQPEIQSQIFQIATQSFKVVFFEIAELFVLDRMLFLFLTSALILAIVNFQHVWSKLFISSLVSCFVIGSINGTVGVNFRYYLPVIPFMLYSIIMTCSFKSGNRLHIKSKETQ